MEWSSRMEREIEPQMTVLEVDNIRPKVPYLPRQARDHSHLPNWLP